LLGIPFLQRLNHFVKMNLVVVVAGGAGFAHHLHEGLADWPGGIVHAVEVELAEFV
jgi:hypothetical protein